MGKTALVIEDDPAFRRFLQPLLEARGLVVREAATLVEATAALAALPERPELIVADGLLPDGSGVEWLRGLTGPERERPVLFVSAHWKGLGDHRELQRQLSGLPALLIVHKPVGPDAFAGQLDLLLGRANAPPLPPELARLMAQLKAEYGTTLRAKLEDLLLLVRAAAAAPADTKARRAARTAAHRLAGTAGSYGFPDESATAAVVEAQAVQAERADGEALTSCWTVAESALNDAILADATPRP